MASPQDLVIESTDFVDDQKTGHKEQGRNLLIVRNHIIISNFLLCHTFQLALGGKEFPVQLPPVQNIELAEGHDTESRLTIEYMHCITLLRKGSSHVYLRGEILPPDVIKSLQAILSIKVDYYYFISCTCTAYSLIQYYI